MRLAPKLAPSCAVATPEDTLKVPESEPASCFKQVLEVLYADEGLKALLQDRKPQVRCLRIL